MAEKNKTVRYKGSELIHNASDNVRDILTVVLDPNKDYTTAQTQKLTEQFLEKEAVRYKGSELIHSVSGTAQDILTVVLDQNKNYTTAQVEKLTEQFLKKEVGK